LILGGLLDWVTWGKPFQSTIEYLRFNLIEKGSELWGVSSRSFYLQTMLATNGLALLALVLGFLAGLARTWPVALLTLLFLAIHSRSRTRNYVSSILHSRSSHLRRSGAGHPR